MHESILDFRGYRYLWISLLVCAAAIAAYVWHDPIQPKSGGTWLGYTLGGAGAALIFWLLLLGIRKRTYGSTLGSIRGWTSAHVYLGTSLLIIATLHSGFQFGWNLHTLAYALMVAVIISGIWGVVMYRRYPARMTRNRNGMTRQMMRAELGEQADECLRLADDAGEAVHRQVDMALESDPLQQPGWWTLLRGRHWTGRLRGNTDGATLEAVLSHTLSAETDSNRIQALNRLLDAVSRRRRLSARLAQDLRLQAWMELWLYLHVPLSMALLAALSAHIVAVFFYW